MKTGWKNSNDTNQSKLPFSDLFIKQSFGTESWIPVTIM